MYMKKFWIDYDASMVIEAETAEDAEGIFYQCFHNSTRLYAEVKNIDEISEEESDLYTAANAEEE